jgi:large subunit ribosomal protein L33
MLFKLVSTADTGYFYVGKKSVQQAANKLNLMKYDPFINKHVVFVEQKLKGSKR